MAALLVHFRRLPLRRGSCQRMCISRALVVAVFHPTPPAFNSFLRKNFLRHFRLLPSVFAKRNSTFFPSLPSLCVRFPGLFYEHCQTLNHYNKLLVFALGGTLKFPDCFSAPAAVFSFRDRCPGPASDVHDFRSRRFFIPVRLGTIGGCCRLRYFFWENGLPAVLWWSAS